MTDEAAWAEQERQDVLRQFPLDEWPDLPLERYALGQDSSQMTYCRLLEYGTLALGSIRGGSAAKHIIYRHKSGEWRLPAPLRNVPIDEAWQRLRAQFVMAFEAVMSGKVYAIDDLDLLLSGQALVTKSLAIYFPDQLLPIYSADHLRRFIRLLNGEPEPAATTWRLNQQLLGLVKLDSQFHGRTGDEVMRYLYTNFDPRSPQRRIWKITPGENGRLWDQCRAARVIRVGWDEVGDLGRYETDTDLRKTLDEQGPDSSGRNLTIARYLLAFRDLEPGDIIVANRGMSEVLGVGTVTSGYQFEPDYAQYRHVVPVNWDVSVARTLDGPQRGWQATFARVSTNLYATIMERAAPVNVPDDVASVLDALAHKGQVILHGPPGTGKTTLAIDVALAMAGSTVATQPRDRLFEAATKSGRVRLVTFHPSYGYEDFVEGYKPSRAPTGSGLTLELTDGVFYTMCTAAAAQPDREFLLIIDEINRGDLPRILGELVTCLELDKRGLPVTLPISRRQFVVPRNLRIIGTMNTADRSISHLDAAIRRRFAFLSVDPDSAAIAGNVGPLNLAGFLDELNDRIAKHLDIDHRLGHAYLMHDSEPVTTDTDLAAAFAHDIVPQLEDYCLGQTGLLRLILGSLVDDGTGQLVQTSTQDLAAKLADEFATPQSGDSDA